MRGVETSFCNPTWTSVHCSKMDLVIVPSMHTKQSMLAQSYTQTEIKVVPETFFDEVLSDPYDLQEIDSLETKFNFLCVAQAGARKNVHSVAASFMEEFKEDSGVGLILKINTANNCTMDFYHTKAAMKALQEAETQIFNLPQCKPVGQLARTCTDLKIESTFPIAGGCSINYEFTVCAYSPFKKGILNNKSLGIQKRPRARSPRRGGGR